MRKLGTFLGALLLIPLLSLNANAFASDTSDVFAPPQQSSGWCYIYHMGRWWLVPC